jgi:Integrase core domain
VRLRASWSNHVWSYDFVEARTHDGRKFRMLCLIDEFTREALAVRVKRKLNSIDVLETLADVMISRGRPDYICSDNGPEFIAKTLRSTDASTITSLFASDFHFFTEYNASGRQSSAILLRAIVPPAYRAVPTCKLSCARPAGSSSNVERNGAK